MQPAFFYGTDDAQPAPSPDATGRLLFSPEDDPLAQRGIPVFKPSMEEFQDFESYMQKIECWGMRSGIVKVIPPKEWTEALPSVCPQMEDVKIMSPIEQNFLGGSGRFRQQNIERRRSMSVREWVELCNKEGYRAPSASEIGLYHHAPVSSRSKRRTARRATSETDATAMKEEDDAINVPASPPITEGNPGSPKEDVELKTSHPTKRKSHKQVADEKAVKDAAFMSKFKPHEDWLPFGMQAEDYTSEYCNKLERHYWRNCGMGKQPWYGADTQGSLFTPDTRAWNVSCLPSYLNRLLPSSSQGLPGVNTPYLYFGMWRATFAWHVEDMDLFSINYIHFGAPKFWYAIPQGRAGAFENTMRGYFPSEPTHCSQFLRHKSFLVSPTTLASSSCRPNTLVQHAGEFVITYPRGYHAGFNLGLNCAESVNFALESWVELGRKARACSCIGDSVRIDVDQLLQDRAAEQTAEQEDEAPRPAPHSKRSTRKPKGEPHPDAAAPQSKKRKPSRSGPDVEMPRAKKIKVKPPVDRSHEASASTKGMPKSVTLKLPAPPQDEFFPCCLCISCDREGLLRVQEPPTGVPTVSLDLSQGWRAHGQCASIVPETWVDEIDTGLGFREKVVFGVDAIVKDRWNLKCNACTRTRLKAHGAPIQCTKGKCSKAFHISCARDGGATGILFKVLQQVEKEVVLLDPSGTTYASGSMDVMDIDPSGYRQADQRAGSEEGTVLKTIRKTEVQVLCSQHNPAVAAAKRIQRDTRIRDALLGMEPMARVKLRVSSGVFEVSLVRVIEETGSVEVIWDRGAKREFKWGNIVFGVTDTPVEQKPSQLSEAATASARVADMPQLQHPPPQASTSYSMPAMQYTPPHPYPPPAPHYAPPPPQYSYYAPPAPQYSTYQPYQQSYYQAASTGYGQTPYGTQSYAAAPHGYGAPQGYSYFGAAPPGAYGSTWQHQQQPHYTYTDNAAYPPRDHYRGNTQLQWQEPYRPPRTDEPADAYGAESHRRDAVHGENASYRARPSTYQEGSSAYRAGSSTSHPSSATPATYAPPVSATTSTTATTSIAHPTSSARMNTPDVTSSGTPSTQASSSAISTPPPTNVNAGDPVAVAPASGNGAEQATQASDNAAKAQMTTEDVRRLAALQPEFIAQMLRDDPELQRVVYGAMGHPTTE